MAACHHFQQEKGAVLLGNARVAAQLALQDPCSHFPAAGGVGCWLLMDESLFRNYLLPSFLWYLVYKDQPMLGTGFNIFTSTGSTTLLSLPALELL